ncbi:MAG: hypothetical protein ACI857_000724 [Arenicella sp.]|jgi:uncharacterized protein YdiU (UPF0061 family)
MKDLFELDNNSHFEKELPADPINENTSRQVRGACYSLVDPKKTEHPELIHLSKSLMDELDFEIKDSGHFTNVMSGNATFNKVQPYAMCYGGHQFGNWAGQLGDGRATNIGDVETALGNWKLQLKGAGPTPYSRGSDGLAVLRSSIREYLCSEAMHNLGVASTRALSLVKTGDKVMRDILYNGNSQLEEGAIVCRTAPSFIRFGNFEYISAQRNTEVLKKLTDYTISHHFKSIKKEGKEKYVQFFKDVSEKTCEMIVHWQRVGFVHGVMNTDNMSILGLTIDYGPYGWLEDYDPGWTPNTTDAQHKRYRYGNQANIALWNLAQLANALYPLIEEVKPLEEILDSFKENYRKAYHKMMADKLGILDSTSVQKSFIDETEKLLFKSQIDMTIFYRKISEVENLKFEDLWHTVEFSTYLEKEKLKDTKKDWEAWFIEYQSILIREAVDSSSRISKMKQVNPKYVLRNYMAQLAIDAADKGDYKIIDELYNLLQNPYEDQPEMEKWFAKRPDWANDKVGCSMLSCSS